MHHQIVTFPQKKAKTLLILLVHKCVLTNTNSYLQNGNISNQLRAINEFITIFTVCNEIKWMFYDNITEANVGSY